MLLAPHLHLVFCKWWNVLLAAARLDSTRLKMIFASLVRACNLRLGCCWCIRVNYSTQSVNKVFDRKAKRLQRDFCFRSPDTARTFEYIRNEISFQIADRIEDVNRGFPLTFDLGCGRGYLSSQLTKEDSIDAIIQGDISHNCLHHGLDSVVPKSSIVMDEETISMRESTFDLVTSCLSLHWVNDLPGCFGKVLHMLKPDGCFLGAAFGGDCLFELRCSLQLAETEREGGMAPHVSPFLQGHDLANLLTLSKFNLVTVDMDQIVVNYPSMFELMEDIKGMGENNALVRRKPLHRDTIAAAASVYKALYGDDHGNVPATYQILYFIGWKPDASQPVPLERGSTPKGFKRKVVEK